MLSGGSNVVPCFRQVVLMSWQPLMRLGFLHMFATNWSVWVQALVRETLDAVLKYNVDNFSNRTDSTFNVV